MGCHTTTPISLSTRLAPVPFPQELLEREARTTAHLEEKVGEFRAKKFAPPQRPVACEEEAAQLVACYR